MVSPDYSNESGEQPSDKTDDEIDINGLLGEVVAKGRDVEAEDVDKWVHTVDVEGIEDSETPGEDPEEEVDDELGSDLLLLVDKDGGDADSDDCFDEFSWHCYYKNVGIPFKF